MGRVEPRSRRQRSRKVGTGAVPIALTASASAIGKEPEPPFDMSLFFGCYPSIVASIVEGNAQLSCYVNRQAWERLPPDFREAIDMAYADADLGAPAVRGAQLDRAEDHPDGRQTPHRGTRQPQARTRLGATLPLRFRRHTTPAQRRSADSP